MSRDDRNPDDRAQDFTDLATQFSAPLTEGSGTAIGPYKLLEQIGEGGFGVVWAAEQREPIKRRVALKIIKVGMDTKQVVARFEAERQALALMDHPNIAKVLGAGSTESGRPYFCMELVKGIAITQYCDENKLTTKDRLGLFIKVCQAIQHAHQKGIIHRDIKPSNILVSIHDDEPVPKVIDFGIAKATHQELTEKTVYTQRQQFIGTPAYVSPEQAGMSSMDIDTRSDVYSLGVLLYELLTGQTPFDARVLMQSGLDEMRKIIREKEPQRPSTKLGELCGEAQTTTARLRASGPPELIRLLRGDLDWIVMRALEKDRTRRYETANGLAADIGRHLSNEPVVARPSTAAYRFQKAWRRNKLALGAGLAVVIALTAGLVVSSWQAQIARESERRSRRLLYVSDMALAGQALVEKRTGRAVELLEKHRPDSNQQDFRGWEWHYLWRETRSDELTTVATHERPASSVVFSADGSRLASFDGTFLNIYHLIDKLTSTKFDTGVWLRSMSFSKNGNLIAIAGDNQVRVIDVETSEETDSFAARVFSGYGSDRFLAFVAGDSTLYVALESGDLLVRDIVGHRDLDRIEAHEGPVTALALSGDESLLLTGGEDGQLKLFEISNSAQPVHRATLDAEGCQRAFDCAISNDNSYVAVGGLTAVDVSGYLRLFDLKAENHKDLKPTGQWIGAVEFSQDDQFLISTGAEPVVQFWNRDSGQPATFYRGHQDEIWSISVSGKDGTIATASKDTTVKLWPGVPPKQSNNAITLSKSVKWLHESADGSHLATSALAPEIIRGA